MNPRRHIVRAGAVILTVGLAIAVLTGGWSGVRGAPPDRGDPFATQNQAAPGEKGDPFALENQAPPLQPGAVKSAPGGGSSRETDNEPTFADLVRFEVSASPTTVRRGTTFTLTINGTVKKGYHAYPITRRAPEQVSLTKIRYDKSPSWKPLWPVRESPSEWVRDTDGKLVQAFADHFTWEQDIVVLPEAQPGALKVQFSLPRAQVCNDKKCWYGDPSFEVPVEVSAEPAATLSPEIQQRLQVTEPPPPEIVPYPGSIGGNLGDRSIWAVLLAAQGAAIAMLFTPCVFPMVPITVNFFLKRSEKKKHNPLPTAAVYSLTIIIVLALAVLVLGNLVVALATNAWLNLILGAVLVFFALSLFGMYDIELPSFLSRFTANREGQGGYLGAVFMALTFTLTSFTCTGPFLGPLLVAAKELQLSPWKLVLASLTYSATFAAPFFVLALFPGLLKRLPKSGGWLNAVKVVMGFLELAAALKFLANTDITLNPGNPWLFTYDTVLVAWIALSATCGIYLLGWIRLPHDSPVEHIGVPRLVLATIFFGFAVYMAPALWRATPTGIIGQGLVAFLPLDTSPAKDDLYWRLIRSQKDYEEAWADAVKQKRPIFIDFTGVTCTNCRANENNVFRLPAVREEFKKYVLVRMYTDSVPSPELSAAEAERQAQQNAAWQQKTFGDASNPLYGIIRPDSGPAIDEQGVLRGRENQTAGLIRDPQKFLDFLKAGAGE
jgi:thiol:disulfide interchange protein